MLKVNGNMKVEDVFQGLKEVANPEDAIHMKAYMKDCLLYTSPSPRDS